MAVAPYKKRVTEDEFLRLPADGRKYEWVAGEIREVPTGFEHDAIAALVAFLLYPSASRYGVITSSQAGFRMTIGNLRSPDVGFTRFERLPGGGRLPAGFLDGAPDLCIEVISPSEEATEMRQKVAEYFASGAQAVWHLFPDVRRITVFSSPTQSITLEEEEEITAGNLIPGFRARVGDIFHVPAPPDSGS